MMQINTDCLLFCAFYYVNISALAKCHLRNGLEDYEDTYIQYVHIWLSVPKCAADEPHEVIDGYLNLIGVRELEQLSLSEPHHVWRALVSFIALLHHQGTLHLNRLPQWWCYIPWALLEAQPWRRTMENMSSLKFYQQWDLPNPKEPQKTL